MFGSNLFTVGRTIITAITLACILIAGSAVAGDREITVAIRATSEGLNLTRPADVQAFYQRIKNAAFVACTRANQLGLAPVADVDECVENSLADAIRRANKTALTQAYLDTHSARAAEARGIGLPTALAAKEVVCKPFAAASL
jgi:UrcA family protein